MPGFLSANISEGQLPALFVDNLHIGHSGHLQNRFVRMPQGVSWTALGMQHGWPKT
jgi:hypothetical protein